MWCTQWHDGFVLAAVLLVFAPLVHDGGHHVFTNFDDPTNYVQNELLNPPVGAPLTAVVTAIASPSTGTVLGVYEPVALLAKLLICRIGGSGGGGCAVSGAARALMLASYALHALNAVLCFRVCLLLLAVLRPDRRWTFHCFDIA